EFPGCVFLQEDRRNPDASPVRLEVPIQGDEGGPLEPRRVRAVDYNLPHKVDFAHRLRVQEERDLQRDVQGLRVGRMGRLFVRLDEADVGRRLVDEGQSAFSLLDGRSIELAEIRLRGSKPSAETESAEHFEEGSNGLVL